MDSFGDRLRQAREKLNLSVEQVSRDTHIAKRYIEGLEREDFSGFPGETYTMGFLRNYAMFLALDPDEMIVAYKNLRMQEQPVPMTELLEDRKGPKPLVILGILAGVIAVAGIGYGAYRLIAAGREAPATGSPVADARSEPAPEGATSGSQAPSAAAYVLDEPAVVRWFSQGDRIVVPFGDVRIDLAVVRVEKDSVYVELPGGVDIFSPGDKNRLDVDGDGKIDLQIQLNSVDVTTGDRKANIGLYKIAKAADEPRTAAPTEAAAVESAEAPDGDTVTAPVRRLQVPVTTLREAEASGPFALALSFSGRCLFRFQVDDAERETRLFLKGGAFQLEAERAVKLWVSNAGVVDARVAGKALELGGQGQVAAVDVHWVRDPETRKQRLRSIPMF